MTDVVMPRLSDSMEEGTILTWLKQVGDEVAVGEELVEIETDKANMVYEADAAGTLTEILAEEGQTLAIGSVIARVDDPAAAGRAVEPPADKPSGGPAEGSGGRLKASPVARRLATAHGVDLARLSGSGPGGRVVKLDVEGAIVEPDRRERARPAVEAPETAKGQVTGEELSKLQATIARRMAESKATAPHFYLEAEIDMSRAVQARSRMKAASGEGEVVPSFNDMVVKACALALREFPRANGAYRDGRFELYSRVNIGIAVAGKDALLVPTVFDADRKGLRQIAIESRQLADRVRDATITPPELACSTFTVSNLGMYGVDAFAAVINAPQAAILAAGAIKERPAVRAAAVVSAHLMSVTLACDHRILYGADGAQFLARVRTLLEEPVFLA